MLFAMVAGLEMSGCGSDKYECSAVVLVEDTARTSVPMGRTGFYNPVRSLMVEIGVERGSRPNRGFRGGFIERHLTV